MFEEDDIHLCAYYISDLAVDALNELWMCQDDQQPILYPGDEPFTSVKELRELLNSHRDPDYFRDYDYPLGIAVNNGNNYGDRVAICRQIESAWKDLALLLKDSLKDPEPLIDFCCKLYFHRPRYTTSFS